MKNKENRDEKERTNVSETQGTGTLLARDLKRKM